MENKQEFKTLSILSMFIVVALSVQLIAPVWNGEASELQSQALFRAESLAYQILESRKESNRGPASVGGMNHLTQEAGRIGSDPWGKQYNFKLFSLANQDQTKILVWSAGPNGMIETNDQQIESNRDNSSPEFMGDDLGIVIVVK